MFHIGYRNEFQLEHSAYQGFTACHTECHNFFPRALPHIYSGIVNVVGNGTTLGAVRRFTLNNGHSIDRRVDGIDQANHGINYTFVENGIPLISFLERFQNTANGCSIHWECTDMHEDYHSIATENFREYIENYGDRYLHVNEHLRGNYYN